MKNFDNSHLTVLVSNKANSVLGSLGGVSNLSSIFKPAADVLNKLYGNGQIFDPMNIFVADPSAGTVNRSSDNGADLIIGGTSNSTLTGGTGSDTFVYLPPSTGATATTETIDDSRGKGNGSIYVGNKVLTASSTVIKYSGTETSAWKMAA